ncbi:MAG: acetate--CoA ligase family protein [Candidatus Hadarchaeales archaeon]
MAQEMKKAIEIISSARRSGYNALLYHDAKQVLFLIGIPVNRTEFVKNIDEAIIAAKNMKYPVVLKVVSRDLSSKAEVGGVKTGVGSEIELRHVFESITRSVRSAVPGIQILGIAVEEHLFPKHEAIIRAWNHERYGAVVMFGLKGVWTESLDDFAFRLAPLSEGEALDMVKETKAYRLAKGLGDKHFCELRSVANAIVKIGDLVSETDHIKEAVIDPLFIIGETGQSIAVDARITLRENGRK